VTDWPYNSARRRRCFARQDGRAVVLLEVICALVLFVVSAAMILGALNMSIRAVRNSDLKVQGSDLAVTLLSKIRMGVLAAADAGPEAFEDEELSDWTWRIAAEPVDNTAAGILMNRVEVIVKHVPSGQSYHLVQLLAGEDQSAGPPAEELAMDGGRP